MAQPEESPVSAIIIEQIYEDALLIEGLHPDPAAMVDRIQQLMQAVLKPATGEGQLPAEQEN